MVTQAYRPFNGLKFGLISTYLSSFIKRRRPRTTLSPETALFSSKISQAWPMVTHAYRHFNGLKFGLISTHISSFIKIGRKMTKLSSEKAIFSTKITQAWRVVNHAERGQGALKPIWIPTYIPSFIKIGQEMLKLWPANTKHWWQTEDRNLSRIYSCPCGQLKKQANHHIT